MEKTCAHCKEVKSLECFVRNGSAKKPYYENCCKSCKREYNLRRNRTIKGVIWMMYASQKKHSVDRGHNPPCYTRDEFYKWVISQNNFHELYNNWVKSGYEKYLKPSCDRIDDYKSYTFNNIRLVTWGDNNRRAHADRINGVNNKCSVGVVQFAKNGRFLSRYNSMHDAMRKTGAFYSHIGKCCRGERKTAGGYKWKFDICI